MKYIIKNIKRITAIMLILITLSSCNEDKILEEVPLDFLSTGNLYSTADEMEQASFAIYERIRGNFYQGSNQRVCVLSGKGSDYSYDGENPAGSAWLTNYATRLIPSDGLLVSWYWQNAFATINYSNTLIAAIEATTSADEIWIGNPQQREIILSEARFFRAYAYRILVTLYGDIPLFEEPVTTVRTDKNIIYDLIESDLSFASQNLPSRGGEAQLGRLTRAAAYHLLSEIYLHRQKYTDAIAAASAVIDGSVGSYALMQSRFGQQLGNDNPVLGGGDVYYDLFRYGNQNLSENTEAIWVVQIQNDIDGGAIYGGERMWGNAYYRMGNDPDGKRAIIGDNPDASSDIYLSAFSRPVSWNKPTNYLAYDIWKSDFDNDIRNARHNMFRDWRYNNPDSPNWFGKPIDFVNDYPSGSRNILRDTSQFIFPFPLKTASPGIHFTDPNRSGGGSNHVDRYAIRLAETLLLRAEAHLGNGDQGLAAADINTVRSRANATPVAPGDVDIDYILDERARELYTESFRLITLMRLGLFVSRTLQYHDNPVAGGGVGAGIQTHNNLFPIPQSEIDLNINGNLEQNPGYN